MNTLFVAWQSPGPTRAWFPIGRLDAQDHDYVFQYTHGALKARAEAGFSALLAFPELERRYEASELFPLFKNRVLHANRKDFAEYLRWLDLDPSDADPIEILGLTGGERQTDSLEVFPKLIKRPDGSVQARFFLHGLRHVAASAQQRAKALETGEALRVAIEVNNPATGFAIQFQTHDGHMIGWAPRYLVDDLCQGLLQSTDVRASVRRINSADAPLARQVLIELHCGVPESYEPMASSDYRVLSA
jgi:hypothetical protein